MTDPNNTEDQELSLDELKDAAGGHLTIVAKVEASTSPWLKENLEPEADDDVLKKNADSLRSDNRF